jgi:hypothetical protein
MKYFLGVAVASLMVACGAAVTAVAQVQGAAVHSAGLSLRAFSGRDRWKASVISTSSSIGMC